MSATPVSRSDRKVLEGTVRSDRMNKTRVVEVDRRLRHSLYGKVLNRSMRLYAHDETNESHVGDRVRVMEVRPLSKLKRWRLVSILEKARVGQDPTAGVGGAS